MDIAILDASGALQNVIIADDAASVQSSLPTGWTATADIPEAPAPQPCAPDTVTNFQLRAALMAMPAPGGTMFDLVDAAVKTEGGVALQAWEYANDVDRTGPLVQQMAAGFGFDEAALDALFTAAAGISA